MWVLTCSDKYGTRAQEARVLLMKFMIRTIYLGIDPYIAKGYVCAIVTSHGERWLQCPSCQYINMKGWATCSCGLPFED
jgi:hypothetical protein